MVDHPVGGYTVLIGVDGTVAELLYMKTVLVAANPEVRDKSPLGVPTITLPEILKVVPSQRIYCDELPKSNLKAVPE